MGPNPVLTIVLIRNRRKSVHRDTPGDTQRDRGSGSKRVAIPSSGQRPQKKPTLLTPGS